MPATLDVNRFIGIPYLEHGRDEAGCDCWGLFRLVYRDCLKIELPEYGAYYADSEDTREVARLIAGELPQWTQLDKGQERPGDGVLMRLRGFPCHVGVYLGQEKILHIHRGTHAAVIDRTRPEWKFRVLGYYRHELA